MSLNLYGWTALVAAGVAVGLVAGVVTPLPPWIALVAGVFATWAVVLVLDRHRFRNLMVHLSHAGLNNDSGAAVVSHLEELGIASTYLEDVFDHEGETYVQRGVLCRQGDIDTVERIMSEHLA